MLGSRSLSLRQPLMEAVSATDSPPRSQRCCVRRTVCLLGLATALAGCSEPPPLPGPQPHPVRGKVVFQGQPARGFRVAFYPLDDREGPRFAPSAITDSNGEFRLQSYEREDGAPAGDYAVTFRWPQNVRNADPDDYQPQVDRLRGHFSNPRASKFHVTVHEGENELDPFVLR